MKIVRKIEDINEVCWCRLTEDNFNTIKKLGIKTAYNDIKDYTENPVFEEDDIFCLYCDCGIFANWESKERNRNIPEIKFELKEPKNSLEQYGFKNPNGYDVEILKVYETNGQKEYVGVIKIHPTSWDSEGKSLADNWNFNLEPIEYKQRIYTKPNNEGFLPKQKFKVSWTRDMSSSLESTGWRLATNEEIERFKN